jgi:hypothetical protein
LFIVCWQTAKAQKTNGRNQANNLLMKSPLRMEVGYGIVEQIRAIVKIWR